jgi:hypothetical protein
MADSTVKKLDLSESVELDKPAGGGFIRHEHLLDELVTSVIAGNQSSLAETVLARQG